MQKTFCHAGYGPQTFGVRRFRAVWSGSSTSDVATKCMCCIKTCAFDIMFVNCMLHLTPSFGEAVCHAVAQCCNTAPRRACVRFGVAVAADMADTSVNTAILLCAYTFRSNQIYRRSQHMLGIRHCFVLCLRGFRSWARCHVPCSLVEPFPSLSGTGARTERILTVRQLLVAHANVRRLTYSA